jgi:hypothetical protein
VSNLHGAKWIRPKKREAIYVRDGHRCVYCAHAVRGALTFDHLVPRELGGTHDASNLVTACRSCNSARQNRSLRSWLFVLRRVHGVDTAKIGPRIRRLIRRPLG